MRYLSFDLFYPHVCVCVCFCYHPYLITLTQLISLIHSIYFAMLTNKYRKHYLKLKEMNIILKILNKHTPSIWLFVYILGFIHLSEYIAYPVWI